MKREEAKQRIAELNVEADRCQVLARDMTLRDFFAGMAAMGLLACANPEEDLNFRNVAADAYNAARCLLVERNHGGEELDELDDAL